jgi:thioredoxin-dependent peroxiredoxin
MLNEQTIAPNISLLNQDEKQVSLSDFLDSWVLLYFYPKDDTPGCTKEACALRDNFPFYEDTGITILGISKDSPKSHKKFIEKYSLPFTLLSDSEGLVAKAYGADGMLGTKRVSYLISPDGTIAKAYPKVSPATHAQEVLEDLKTLKS